MNGHNPDILTCLANLSADEVFTPPKLASAILDILPTDLFRRPDTTFLDPVCKSGVFLREIARRLNERLKNQMPDEQGLAHAANGFGLTTHPRAAVY
jgi:site-specific DNA-methyltransferase (adenine-specific)